MCEIFETRINEKANKVFIHLEDQDGIGIRKMSIPQYRYALSFGNLDFLAVTAQKTTNRDLAASYYAIPFVDPAIKYSQY